MSSETNYRKKKRKIVKVFIPKSWQSIIRRLRKRDSALTRDESVKFAPSKVSDEISNSWKSGFIDKKEELRDENKEVVLDTVEED
eukprot:snap_masked-scaffold_31-processed-gene-0.27-mRNA-1 protein AED:1.00 eAED:1.00 QI:0/-1/0/0/-1/1/1/0/84